MIGVADADGDLLERTRYLAYGGSQTGRATDADGDGMVGTSDLLINQGAWGSSMADPGYETEADADIDGMVGTSDLTALLTDWGKTTPADRLSREANIVGYAGYVFEPATGLYLVRHRWYEPGLGRWTKRDPLGYVDGQNRYEYSLSKPISSVDPMGLQSATLPGQLPDGLERMLERTALPERFVDRTVSECRTHCTPHGPKVTGIASHNAMEGRPTWDEDISNGFEIIDGINQGTDAVAALSLLKSMADAVRKSGMLFHEWWDELGAYWLTGEAAARGAEKLLDTNPDAATVLELFQKAIGGIDTLGKKYYAVVEWADCESCQMSYRQAVFGGRGPVNSLRACNRQGYQTITYRAYEECTNLRRGNSQFDRVFGRNEWLGKAQLLTQCRSIAERKYRNANEIQKAEQFAKR